MTISELRKTLMDEKKLNSPKAKVYEALLASALLIAKEDGNREATYKDIEAAAKKELKETKQSKEMGAPFNEFAFEICEKLLPKFKNKEETLAILNDIISKIDNPTPKSMGLIMKEISAKYGEEVDKSLVSSLARDLLN